MDGITGTPTLGGVVVGVLAAAGYAVFKVMFRKMLGGHANAPIGQIAFTFSFIGFLNLVLFWPVCIALYWSGMESMSWDAVSVSVMFILSILLLSEFKELTIPQRDENYFCSLSSVPSADPVWQSRDLQHVCQLGLNHISGRVSR